MLYLQKKREVISGAKYMTTLALIHSRCSLVDQTAQWDWFTSIVDKWQSSFSSVICMLMHGQANGTISVTLHHFGSFVCAVSPWQPNWCLTAVILTANNSSSHTQMQMVPCNPKWKFLYDLFVSFQWFVYRETEKKRLENI